MISLYTETLQQYIDNGGNMHLEKFAQIPPFVFDSVSYNAYDLFWRKYKFREIGAETEEMFDEYLGIKLDEVIIKYAEKIKLYIENFKKAFDRYSTLQRDISSTKNMDRNYSKGGTVSLDGTVNSDGNEKSYVNPIVTDNAKVQDYTTSEQNNTKKETETYNLRDTEDKTDTESKTETYQQLHTIFKTNSELLEQAMNIRSIYYEMIESFGNLFMGVY